MYIPVKTKTFLFICTSNSNTCCIPEGPHYEAHVMSVQDWQTCVPLLNALGTLNGLKYEPRWKHIYNKIYKNGVEVLSRKKRKRKTTKPR